MKNTVMLYNLQKCISCELKGFFCYSSDDGNNVKCSSCGNGDFLNSNLNNEKYQFLFEDYKFDHDMRNLYKYCNFCKIIFDVGCLHNNNESTNVTYNCHFVKKWIDNTTKITYDGMPEFDNEHDWFDNINNIKILEMYCPHKGNKCSKTDNKTNEKCNSNNSK